MATKKPARNQRRLESDGRTLLQTETEVGCTIPTLSYRGDAVDLLRQRLTAGVGLLHLPQFFDRETADRLSRELHDEMPGEHIRLHRAPEPVGAYRVAPIHGDVQPTTAWLPIVAAIHRLVETVVFPSRDRSYGNALLDCHQGDEVGFADFTNDEGIQLLEGPIALISLGGPRRLIVTHTETEETHQLTLTSGGLLVLNGTPEWFWQAVPLEKGTGPWINLTFLRLKLGQER